MAPSRVPNVATPERPLLGPWAARKHSPKHALALVQDAHNDPDDGDDLRLGTKRALRLIIEKCSR